MSGNGEACFQAKFYEKIDEEFDRLVIMVDVDRVFWLNSHPSISVNTSIKNLLMETWIP